MTSPFSDFVNATLHFQVATGSFTRDDVGNPVDVVQEETVTAMLKKLSAFSASQVNRLPGVDDTALLLEGYCVEPMILPDQVLAETVARATWSGLPGKFWLMSPVNPPYGKQGIGAISEAAAGTKIRGWFQVDRAQPQTPDYS